MKFLVSVTAQWDENLLIICWFYGKNYIFYTYNQQNFYGDRPPSKTPGPPLALKVEVLELPLVMGVCCCWDTKIRTKGFPKLVPE